MSTATLPGPRTSTRSDTRRDTRDAPGHGSAPAPRPSARRTATAQDARASGTAPFVLLIMVLLTGGLVATLWLSTAAAADSYRLDEARQVTRDLSEQTERLHRDVEAAQSAPALAAAARAQGMVPAGEPAVLLVAPDGSSQVVGDPQPAEAPPAPAPPAPVPPAPDPESNGAQAASDGRPAPAPAGAAAAEDQLVAVPSGQPDQAGDRPAQQSEAQSGPETEQPGEQPAEQPPDQPAAQGEATSLAGP